MPARQPDILIIMADQMVPSALPFHGNPIVATPAMSWLAESGVVFDAAYTGSPLCAPGRASFMTGLLPSRHRAYDNAAEFTSEIPTFAHYLRRAGYRTVLSGKMHFCGTDQLHGFEERLTTDIYPADYGWTPNWDRPHERPSWYHDMLSVIDAGPCVRSNQLDFDDEVAFAAERSLFSHIRSGDERPFCYVVSFSHPHDPFAIPSKWWDLYRDEDIPMPDVGYDEASLHPHERRLREVCAMNGVEITDAQVRAARRAYYGAISYVDDHTSRLIGLLRETGRLDDTVVIVTSDHGEMLGERGAWYKMSFYEGSARVPLVVRAPRLFEPGRVSTAVSTMDLLPTLFGLAHDGDESGAVGPLDGRSLLPHLSGVPDHDDTVAEYLAEGAIAPIVMIRRGRLKFIHSPADPDQLFDLVADPHEQINLVDDPSSVAVVEEFRREVAARWDLAALDREVRESQQRRFAVSQALGTGVQTPWDFTPTYDASHRYIRNHMDLNDLEEMARFPPVR
ncbi:MAG TPA: choline-sulfatase [Mycobacteriales bacterium]|jgi:choline-sulfatase|nr:choline-sulfatase [Mycobacteriales bacterium]